MSYSILNQLLKWYERVRGDVSIRIAKTVLISGITLLVGGWTVRLFVEIKEDALPVEIAATLNDLDPLVKALGALLTVLGAGLLIFQFAAQHKRSKSASSILFVFQGFPNQTNEPPLAIAEKRARSAVAVSQFPKIDSYNPDTLVREHSYRARQIQERVHHAGAAQAYIAALGSVPFLYLTGTMLNDGHIPLTLMEHSRTDSKWRFFDDVGPSPKLELYFQRALASSSLQECIPNSDGDIGLSVSFTNGVLEEELPEAVRGHTVDARLRKKFGFDAISVEHELNRVVTEIAHVMSTLSKRSQRIHLFLCAQASVVFKLGTLYQSGLTGNVVIHNYDPTVRRYPWAIEFDGKQPTLYVDSSSSGT